MSEKSPIYLDYNATTPLTEEVITEMLPYLQTHFGNPSSSHLYGRTAKRALETARQRVADLIGANPDEILFTGGGTESNNIAICGAALAAKNLGNHLVTSDIEHPAVINVFHYLANQGYQVITLPVSSTGLVSPDDLAAALKPDTILVSIMHANNEVGTIQPIQQLASIAHQAGALFHTDAAQSVGKIAVNVNDLSVDLLSIAGHKLYAPKGVGSLYIRRGIKLEKTLFGASQEGGMRPGTENIASIAGLGSAALQAQDEINSRSSHLQAMRDRLHHGLKKTLPEGSIRLNGHLEKRLPNTLNLSFKSIQSDKLLEVIGDTVAASAGAACHADSVEISSVLQAMAVPLEWAQGAARFSVGRMTTNDEIDRAVMTIAKAVKLLL